MHTYLVQLGVIGSGLLKHFININISDSIGMLMLPCKVKKAVSAYFARKQILPTEFAGHFICHWHRRGRICQSIRICSHLKVNLIILYAWEILTDLLLDRAMKNISQNGRPKRLVYVISSELLVVLVAL